MKKWRELRRELRRAKEPELKRHIELNIQRVEKAMNPKVLKELKESYDVGVQ